MQRDDVRLNGCAAIDSCDCSSSGLRWPNVPDGHNPDSGMQHRGLPSHSPAASNDGHTYPDHDPRAHHCSSCAGLLDGQLVRLWHVQCDDVRLDGRALLDALGGDARLQWRPGMPSCC